MGKPEESKRKTDPQLTFWNFIFRQYGQEAKS